jgi:glycosyltransferase involved in cell wall biosynthesis
MTRVATFLEWRALHDSRTVFALSQYTARSIKSLVSGLDVRVVHCGVDTDLFTPSGARSTAYILSVARFSDPRKNVTVLLLAYAQLCAAVPETPTLYLVGEPPTASGHRLLADLGIENRVRFLGFIPDSQLADLYRGALFFVLSSDEEGLGIVILEAMASGLATVATRCGGPEDVVEDGHSGFLVPVRDGAALALAMRRMITEPGLAARFGQRARQIAVDRFSLDAAGQVFLSTYDKLLQPEL